MELEGGRENANMVNTDWSTEVGHTDVRFHILWTQNFQNKTLKK